MISKNMFSSIFQLAHFIPLNQDQVPETINGTSGSALPNNNGSVRVIELPISASYSTKEILDFVGHAHSLLDIRVFFSEMKSRGVPLKEIEPNSFYIDGFQIDLGIATYTNPEVAILEKLNALQITAAPTFILHKVFKDNGSVKVIYYPGCEVVAPKGVLGKVTGLSKEARERLAIDLLCLAREGFYHPLALRDRSLWLTPPGGNQIFLQGWRRLRRISVVEQGSLQNSIDSQILTGT